MEAPLHLQSSDRIWRFTQAGVSLQPVSWSERAEASLQTDDSDGVEESASSVYLLIPDSLAPTVDL